ncbi:TPA: Glutathione S-transferase 2 [Trebouxia sp. C0005]
MMITFLTLQVETSYYTWSKLGVPRGSTGTPLRAKTHSQDAAVKIQSSLCTDDFLPGEGNTIETGRGLRTGGRSLSEVGQMLFRLLGTMVACYTAHEDGGAYTVWLPCPSKGGIGPCKAKQITLCGMHQSRLSMASSGIQARQRGCVEKHLASGKDWLAADQYTIADMANFAWIAWHDWAAGRQEAFHTGVQIDDMPHIQKWMKRIAERPAIQKAMDVPDKNVVKQYESDPRKKQEMINGAKKFMGSQK